MNSPAQFVVPVVAMALASSCAAQSGCVERNVDRFIVAAGEPYFRAERFAEAIQPGRSREDVVAMLGKPKSSREPHGGAVELAWVYGESQKGETYRCDKLVDVAYMTSFTTMTIEFANGVEMSCRARVDTFITKAEVDYEKRGDPVDTKNLTCSALARRE